MNLKQIGILLAVVIVIGGGALILHNKQGSSWSSADAEVGKKLLGDFPFNDVTHIQIQHGTNELNLEKKNDVWCVRERGDYPANFSQISDFLLKARDLKVVQSEEVGPSQLPRLELAPGQGSNAPVVVDFKGQGDKLIRTLLLGKKHMKSGGAPSQFGGGDEAFPDGRYVKAGTNSTTVALISDPLDSIDTQPDQWIDKDFLHIAKPKTIEAIFPTATNSWKLARPSETADWKLEDAKPGETLDSSKTSSLGNPLSSASFTDVLPQSKSDQLGTNKPTVVKIGTFDDVDYTLNIGAKTNDDYLVTVSVVDNFPEKRPVGVNEKPEDKPKIDKIYQDAVQKAKDAFTQAKRLEGWTYLVAGWEIDPLLKERSQLLAEKKEEPKKSEGSSTKSGETNQVESAAPVKAN